MIIEQFVSYDLATGRVIASGTSHTPEVLATSSIGILVGAAAEPGEDYIDSGAVTTRAVCPSSDHVFNWNTKQWADPRTLQDLKDAAWERIKAARGTYIDLPLVTPYGTFDSGAKDRINITDAILLLQTLTSLGTPTSIVFTLANNSTQTLNTAEMVTVGLLLGQKVQAAHANARVRRAEIEASTTKEQIDAIVW